MKSPSHTGAGALGAVILSGASFQFGAAFGATLFPIVGALAVVGLRMAIAAPVLLLLGRPRLRDFRGADLLLCLALGVVMAFMSIALYSAVDRVGLGIAVTIEFLGPLTVALLGSRHLRDAPLAILAALAVAGLTGLGGHRDLIGILLAFTAAALWAIAIRINAHLRDSVPGNQVPAVGMAVSALICVPLGAVTGGSELFRWHVLAVGVGAAVFASVFPPILELYALRRLTAGAYGTLMALYPAISGVAGALVLGESLTVFQWLCVATICGVCALSTVRPRPVREPTVSSSAAEAQAPETVKA